MQSNEIAGHPVGVVLGLAGGVLAASGSVVFHAWRWIKAGRAGGSGCADGDLHGLDGGGGSSSPAASGDGGISGAADAGGGGQRGDLPHLAAFPISADGQPDPTGDGHAVLLPGSPTETGSPKMSLFSQTFKNVSAWFSGSMSFDQLKTVELNDLHKVTASLSPAVQPGVTAMIDRMAADASAVGQIAGQAIAPLLNQSADAQADQVMTLLKAVGVNPVVGTPLTALEHAALATVITGLHATLDRVGIAIAHIGAPAATSSSGAQPAQNAS